MIEDFTKAWFANKDTLAEKFKKTPPESYQVIVKEVITLLASAETKASWDYVPDPERITEIDHGDYQGTLLYVVAADDYQPSTFWFVKVGYGSCSGCDTLQAIDSDIDPATGCVSDESLEQYMTLALHVVQGLKAISDQD